MNFGPNLHFFIPHFFIQQGFFLHYFLSVYYLFKEWTLTILKPTQRLWGNFHNIDFVTLLFELFIFFHISSLISEKNLIYALLQFYNINTLLLLIEDSPMSISRLDVNSLVYLFFNKSSALLKLKWKPWSSKDEKVLNSQT